MPSIGKQYNINYSSVYGTNRDMVFRINQLGGIGRRKSMFVTGADGVNKTDDELSEIEQKKIIRKLIAALLNIKTAIAGYITEQEYNKSKLLNGELFVWLSKNYGANGMISKHEVLKRLDKAKTKYFPKGKKKHHCQGDCEDFEDMNGIGCACSWSDFVSMCLCAGYCTGGPPACNMY